MDKKTDSTYLRLPSKLRNLIELYANQKGLRNNDAIIHLIARGLWFEKLYSEFHIEEYTQNFFSNGVSSDKE